jgi:hypothetical protein
MEGGRDGRRQYSTAPHLRDRLYNDSVFLGGYIDRVRIGGRLGIGKGQEGRHRSL